MHKLSPACLPCALCVEEEHEVDWFIEAFLHRQHILRGDGDRHTVVEVTSLRHLGIDDLEQQKNKLQF